MRVRTLKVRTLNETRIMEFMVIAWPVLAIVAAWIAKAKGRSFLLWLIYGLALMPLALIHALVARSREPAYVPISVPSMGGASAVPVSIADELIKLADLQERGFITKAEYELQKAKLLGERQTAVAA